MNLRIIERKKQFVCKNLSIACASDIAAVGPIFNIFSSAAIWPKNQTHHLPNAEETHSMLYQSGFYATHLI